jgi:SSS family solute:Na+ symporter
MDRKYTLIFSGTGLHGDDFSFWPMLFGGLFLYMSYYGCDQSQAQRLLAAKSSAAARNALVLNALLRFPLVLTYCFFGLLLAGLLHSDPSFSAAVSQGPPENLVPQFVVSYLPNGLRGLFVAAIFAAAMSSIDSAMNSLAAVTLEDIFGQPPAAQSVWLSRTVSLAWGVFAIVSGLIFARSADSLIIVMNRIGSAFSGPILAVFALAIASRHVKGAHVIAGLFSGLGGTLLLSRWLPGVSWLWWNPFGFFVTCGVTLILSGSRIELPEWKCPPRQTQILIGMFLVILFTIAMLG